MGDTAAAFLVAAAAFSVTALAFAISAWRRTRTFDDRLRAATNRLDAHDRQLRGRGDAIDNLERALKQLLPPEMRPTAPHPAARVIDPRALVVQPPPPVPPPAPISPPPQTPPLLVALPPVDTEGDRAGLNPGDTISPETTAPPRDTVIDEAPPSTKPSESRPRPVPMDEQWERAAERVAVRGVVEPARQHPTGGDTLRSTVAELLPSLMDASTGGDRDSGDEATQFYERPGRPAARQRRPHPLADIPLVRPVSSPARTEAAHAATPPALGGLTSLATLSRIRADADARTTLQVGGIGLAAERVRADDGEAAMPGEHREGGAA